MPSQEKMAQVHTQEDLLKINEGARQNLDEVNRGIAHMQDPNPYTHE